jgi:hypothetical protein
MNGTRTNTEPVGIAFKTEGGITTGCSRRCSATLRNAADAEGVGHLLLKSFWANEAVFQMMMLSYNLFLLFKFDFLGISEFRQQIKTFRLKYVFLAGKIIRSARYIVMKLPAKYPYQDVYEKCLA